MARMHSEGCTVIRLENEIDTDLNIRVDTVRFPQALLSALTYPQKYKEKREIDFKVTLDTEKNFINFRITNSPLADERFTSQEVCIRHEINRLLFEYFWRKLQSTDKSGRKADHPLHVSLRKKLTSSPIRSSTSTESCIFATCKLKPFFMYTNKQIWSVSYPILLSLLAQNVINVTDTAFLGRVSEIAPRCFCHGWAFLYLYFHHCLRIQHRFPDRHLPMPQR